MTRLWINVFVLHYVDVDRTLRCVNALLDNVAQHDVEITVVDNGSPEPFDSSLVDSDVCLVRHRANLPLIQAFNQAIERHPAQLYICCANDTVADPNMIQALADAFQGNESLAVAAPGTNDSGAGALFIGEGPQRERGPVNIQHVDNSVWAFTDWLVADIGLPDCEGHPHRACWASNADYCYRAREAGYAVAMVPAAYYWHENTGGQDPVAHAAGWAWLRKKWGAQEADRIWQ